MTEPKPDGKAMDPSYATVAAEAVMDIRAKTTVPDELVERSMSTAIPSGREIDPIDELVRWDALSDEALQVTDAAIDATSWLANGLSSAHEPTLLERIEWLEARVAELEAKAK